MNLNSHRKEIIKRILSGDVFDIYSFLKSFDYLEYYKLDIDDVNEKFRAEENGKLYKVPDIEGTFEATRFAKMVKGENVDFSESDFKYVKAICIIETPGYLVKFSGKEYKFFFGHKEIAVAKNYNDILEFVTLWQQLQNQGLIFEIEKEISSDDIALFYELYPTKETPYYKKMILDREKAVTSEQGNFPNGYVRVPTYDCYEDLKAYGVSEECFWGERWCVQKNELSYCEKYPVFNELHLTTCKDFVSKKIVATPLLNEYVSNNYQTSEEKKSKWALIGTWVAIGISFLMAGFSIFATFNVDPSNSNLTNIQSQLERIEMGINGSNKEQLDEILLELHNIDFSKYNDAELQEKVDSIIDLLNKISENSK